MIGYRIFLWCQGCHLELDTWTTDLDLLRELANILVGKAKKDGWVQDEKGLHFCPNCQIQGPRFDLVGATGEEKP